MGLPFRLGPRMPFKVEVRNSSGARVLGYFLTKHEAESAMADLDQSDEIDSYRDILWLVEVAPDGTERDLYGYT